MTDYTTELQSKNFLCPFSEFTIRQWRIRRDQTDLIKPLSQEELEELRIFFNTLPEDSIIKYGKFSGYWPKMIYFSEIEKNSYEIFFNMKLSKIVYNRSGNIVPVDSKSEFITFFGRSPEEDDSYLGITESSVRFGKSQNSCFVITKIHDQIKMYIFPYRANTIHHSTMSDGETIFAGMININNGKIAFISNDSGHYRFHMNKIDILLDFFNSITSHKPELAFDDGFIPEKSLKIFSPIDYHIITKGFVFEEIIKKLKPIIQKKLEIIL